MKAKQWFWVLGVTAAGIAAGAWLLNRQLQKQAGRSFADEQPGATAERFGKRIFANSGQLRQTMDYFLNHPEELKMVFQGKRVSRPFAERIMLVVTGVNACRYCRFAHTHSAAGMGIPTEHIFQLLGGDLTGVEPDQEVGLAFALHYAETGGEPEPEIVSNLEGEYGTDKARDILSIIQVISFLNLCGNTLDALLSRFQGRPALDSTLKSELGTVGLMLAGAIPYTIALVLRVLVADTPDSVRANVLVLQR